MKWEILNEQEALKKGVYHIGSKAMGVISVNVYHIPPRMNLQQWLQVL